MTLGPDFNQSARDRDSHFGRGIYSDFQYPKSEGSGDIRAPKIGRDGDRSAQGKDLRCSIILHGLILFSFSCALASCSSAL